MDKTVAVKGCQMPSTTTPAAHNTVSSFVPLGKRMFLGSQSLPRFNGFRVRVDEQVLMGSASVFNIIFLNVL